MKKLALALMLALCTAGAFAPAHALTTNGFPGDGISRPDGRAHVVKRKQRHATRRGKRVPVANRRRGANRAALAPVKEIDGDGLRELLQRGDAQTARPLLVNFWATWCVPCRMEFPDLVKIGADYRGRGLEFILVSADDVSEIKTSVPKFLREMRATAMPAYLLNAPDTEAAISQVDPAWGGELPATFLFDRQGKLAYKHFGIINAAELRQEIEKVVTSDK